MRTGLIAYDFTTFVQTMLIKNKAKNNTIFNKNKNEYIIIFNNKTHTLIQLVLRSKRYLRRKIK